MRKTFLFILSITGMACFLLLSQPAAATVYDQFQQVTTRNWGGDFRLSPDLQQNFVVLTDGTKQGEENKFRLHPNPQTRPDTELDDGYAEIPLGFTYRYNGVDYTKIYVSINGFITFDTPPAVANGGADNPCRYTYGLFVQGASIPTNVVAPYWGDHKYWPRIQSNIDAGYAPSEIGYVNGLYKTTDPETNLEIEKKFCLVQWKDLNVNWRKIIAKISGIGYDTINYKGNVASFQVIIYEGPNATVAQQGNIEFRYNTLGPTSAQLKLGKDILLNPLNSGAVGFKGNISMVGDKADYVNAIYNGFDVVNYPADVFKQRNDSSRSTRWPASGDVARSIMLLSSYSVHGSDTWGDGDADMSKAPGGRHASFMNIQNLFVTVSDVRTIMKSVVTGVPLDSVYRKAAFHADVHHDGRYYFLTNRNSGVFRALNGNNNTLQGEIVLDNAAYNIDQYSKDTFYIRKVGPLEGKFGFSPYYGTNANYMMVDFFDMGGLTIEKSTIKVRLAEINNTLKNDYQVMVIVTDTNDRALLWRASDNFVNTKENMVRISLKKNITWRDDFMNQNISDLPGISSPETQIFYEANEKDAAIILGYLGGKIPSLPWKYENPEFNGKNKATFAAPYQVATNIQFENAVREGEYVKIPVYFNGMAENAKSALFNLNTEIVNFESANPDVYVDFSNNTGKAVIVADGYFMPNAPVAYLTVAKDVNNITASNVRFDGNDASDVMFKLNTNTAIINELLNQNTPNPVANYTTFEVTIPEAGNYTFAIYDLNGNVVKTIANDNFDAKTISFTWDATNNNNNKVAEGTYVYRLIGEKTSVSKKLVVAY